MPLVSMARWRRFIFALLLLHPVAWLCCAAQTSLPSVTIRQLLEVRQGQAGQFEVRIAPVHRLQPIILRLACDLGTGRAVFDDGSTEKTLTESAMVSVLGVTSSDLPGALTLTAWTEGALRPAATAFFDVLAANPQPRIFFEGFDVTGTHQSG